MPDPGRIQALLITCGAWYLRQTAQAFHQRQSLAGLWISEKNNTGIPPALYRRCWPFHVAMKPFYHLASDVPAERAFYAFFPLWRAWLATQRAPVCNVVQAIVGYATEAFDQLAGPGVLKVVDCPNSHPASYYGYWQRECDLWCPGERVPIPQWMFARMNRELERADLIIVQSKFCKESMVANGIPADKVIVNLMGADTTIFQPRTEVPRAPRFICVGTISLRKGHQYLFRAFQLVKQKLPAAELICAGPWKGDFRRERPQWEGTFTHHEFLPPPELARLLQTATAFVFPSQEEGIARAQIEALACGLPVIGTHEGGATTLVDDGVEGFIVRGRDPAHIAEAMLKIAADREMNRRMGEAAYRKGGLKNSWQDYGDRLLAEFSRRLPAPH